MIETAKKNVSQTIVFINIVAAKSQ